MSTFTESIILTNAGDKFAARRGFIPESAIRTVTVNAWVDTGAWTLVINEEVRAKLGLELENTRVSTLADGTQVEYCMTEPVEFRWKDRW
ncbi:MAG: aspartyl protease family protein, partial [Spirochaetaceae bacterium]|nr:aspartyl protease family protein [Spirochaetaceae bacterium]